ncbi:MAG: sugar ABC transporter substrate-binding protein, partial [Mesorhizobium sp.]
MKKIVAALAALAICAAALVTPALAQDKKYTIAL